MKTFTSVCLCNTCSPPILLVLAPVESTDLFRKIVSCCDCGRTLKDVGITESAFDDLVDTRRYESALIDGQHRVWLESECASCAAIEEID